MEHEHGEAFYGTNVDAQLPEWKAQLRHHMKADHQASDDWAALVDADLIAEVHNREHGRDAHGVAL
jgi:hypothetical protein